MTSSVVNYFSKKRQIENFRQMVFRGCEPDELAPLLNVIMLGGGLVGHTMPGEYIYRCRVYIKGALFSHVDELKYPPSHGVKMKGRLNDVGQSVFYGSNSELGTLIEARPDLERLFVISKIVRKRPSEQPFFIGLGMKTPNYIQGATGADHPPLNRTDKQLTEFLHKEVTRPASDANCYNASIAIANHFFKVSLLQYADSGRSLVSFAGSNYPGLIYPSVHGQKICNVTTYNLAMLPRTFDENYKIIQTDIYTLTHEPVGNLLVLASINTGIVDTSGMIEWQYTHGEMKGRTETGIFGLDIYVERLKGVAKLI